MQACVLIGEGDFASAADRMDRLYPKLLAVFGPTRHQTLLFLLTRSQALIWLGRHDRAVHDDLLLYQPGTADQGASYITLGAPGGASCRCGRAADGLAEETKVFDAALATFGDGSSLTQLLSDNVGLCLVLMKRHSEAGIRPDRIDRVVSGRADARADNDASLDLMPAEITEAAGTGEEARLRLRHPVEVFSRPGQDPSMRRWPQQLPETVAGQRLTQKQVVQPVAAPVP